MFLHGDEALVELLRASVFAGVLRSSVVFVLLLSDTLCWKIRAGTFPSKAMLLSLTETDWTCDVVMVTFQY